MSEFQHPVRRADGRAGARRATARRRPDSLLALASLLIVGVSGYGVIMMTFAAFQLSA